MFPSLCVSMGLPRPEAEHLFHLTRKWRFDFSWPEYRVALEVEGGTWVNGGHSRGSGRTLDREKFNAAAALGWRILYCTPQEVLRGDTIDNIRNALYCLQIK